MTNTNTRAIKTTFLFLFLLLPLLLAGLIHAQEPSTTPRLMQDKTATAVQLPDNNPTQAQEIICKNLIVNSQLNVVDTGGGSFTAVPWQFLEPILYYTQGSLAYDGTSFILKDGDPGDPSPTEDAFAQTLQLPAGLTSLTVEYQRRTQNGNKDDIVWGELWLVDNQGNLEQDVTYWDVYESADQWEKEALDAPGSVLPTLNGRKIALLLYNDTDGSSPDAPDAEKEWMLFDDITLTACYDPDAVIGRAYMPILRRP